MSQHQIDQGRLLLNEVEELLDRAFDAHDRSDDRAAVKKLQQASVLLLRLAKQTPQAELKQQRLDQVEKMEQLQKQWSSSGSGGSSRKSRQDPAKEEGESQFHPESERPEVRFDDVAGLESVKQEIQLRMVLPFQHPQEAARFGVTTGGGMLLYGPPGTGKTLIARATAGELDAAFFTIKASDIMSKWVGEAEQNVQALFAAARSYPRSVLFIDEIEALVPARDGNASTVMARVVPQFLAEMDGFSKGEGSLLVIGATNEPWAMDPAMLRPGRFDVQVYVDLPDLEAREHLLRLGFEGRPLAADVDLTWLARQSNDLSGADIKGYIERASRNGFQQRIQGGSDELQMVPLQQLLEQTIPSVKPQQLKRYQKYRDSFSGSPA